jgi:hypothetical protein
VPRARTDALDLAVSSFLATPHTLTKGLLNLLSLAGIFLIATAIIEGGLGRFLRFLPWLLDMLLCPQAARDLRVVATLMAVCLALAWGAFESVRAFARSCTAPPAAPLTAGGGGGGGSSGGAAPLPHTRSLLLRHLLWLGIYLLWMVCFMASVTVSPLWACMGLILAVSILLKVHSFTMTNAAMARERSTAGGGSWPRNVTAPNFFFFLCAPTLTYEAAYPRSPSIRPLFLLLKLCQGLATAVLGFAVLFTAVIPILTNPTSPASPLLSALPQQLQGPSAFLLDLVRLALPSILLWLCVFVGFFSCALGCLAEVTRFADRQFYLNWWEAKSLGAFWSSWNRPVHCWAKRHLLLELQTYLHLKRRGAVLATFLLSAILHELILCLAFKTLRPYFFFAMLGQLPLIALSRSIDGSSGGGNALVWLSLFLGQPLLELLYAREFLLLHSNSGQELLCLK